MAGLKHLFDIYNQKGKEFVDNLFSNYVTINEKMDGSAFLVEKNSETGELEFYKRSGKSPINKIDRILARYYEPAIKHFESLDPNIKNKIPPNWVLGFEYFPDTNPVEIKYDEIPENNLMLSYIHIKDEKGKIKKTLQEKKDLDSWAQLLKVSVPPIIYQGILNDEQKVAILDFLNTPFSQLVKKFKTESFVKYIIKILSPKLKRTALNKSLDSDIEGIVFRFGVEEGEEVVLAKLVDPVFTELAKKKSKDKNNKKPNDIYIITVLDVMNYVAMNIRKFKPRGRGFDNKYINFISSAFNSFVEEYGENYRDLDFEIPEYMKKDYFGLGIDFIEDEKTRELVSENPAFEQLFKIMVATFRKKKRRPTYLFTKDLIKQFNGVVDRIHDHLMGIREAAEIPSFGEYVSKIPYDIEEEEEGEYLGYNQFKDRLSKILEVEPMDNKPKQGKRKVNLIIGRFQPFHNGHLKMAEQLKEKNGLPSVLAVVHTGKNKGGESPFPSYIIETILSGLPSETDSIIGHVFVKDGWAGNVIENLRPDYEPVLWGSGEDRIDGYKKQLEYNTKRENEFNILSEFEIVVTPRTTSATEVRKAIEEDDFQTFKKMVPRSVQSQWILLKKIIENALVLRENVDATLFFDPENQDISTLHLETVSKIRNEKDGRRMRKRYLENWVFAQSLEFFDIIEEEIITEVNNIRKFPLCEFTASERELFYEDVEKYLMGINLSPKEMQVLAITIQEKIKLPIEIIEGKSLFKFDWEKLVGHKEIRGIIEFLNYQTIKSEDGRGELPLALIFEDAFLPKAEGDLLIEAFRFEVKHGVAGLRGIKGFSDGGIKILRDMIQDKTYVDILDGIDLNKIEEKDEEERRKIWKFNLKQKHEWPTIIEGVKDKDSLCEAFVDYFCERWNKLRKYPDLLEETKEYFKEFSKKGEHKEGFYPLSLINAKYYQRVEEFKGIISISEDNNEVLFFNPETITLQEFKDNIKIHPFNWNHHRSGKAFEFKQA